MLGNGAEDLETKILQLGHGMIIHETARQRRQRVWLPDFSLSAQSSRLRLSARNLDWGGIAQEARGSRIQLALR
jgi:hypothetical protein